MATVEQAPGLMTAEEFARLPESNHFEELVRGRIVAKPLRGVRHGAVCARLVRHLGDFAERTGTGHALCNNAGFITESTPDTVRGPDLSYYSNERLSEGDVLIGYSTVPPEFACEVLSPDDRWDEMISRVVEYFQASVLAVVVVDPEARTVHDFRPDRAPCMMGPDDLLRLDPILPGFEVTIGRLFA